MEWILWMLAFWDVVKTGKYLGHIQVVKRKFANVICWYSCSNQRWHQWCYVGLLDVESRYIHIVNFRWRPVLKWPKVSRYFVVKDWKFESNDKSNWFGHEYRTHTDPPTLVSYANDSHQHPMQRSAFRFHVRCQLHVHLSIKTTSSLPKFINIHLQCRIKVRKFPMQTFVWHSMVSREDVCRFSIAK